MGKNREFEVAFVGLKPGIHVFEYELGDEFFTEKAGQPLSHLEANVKMSLDKHSGFLMLKFEVGGQSTVSCDRCGNPLQIELWDEFSMLVKLVDDPEKMNAEEEDPDVFYISRADSHLDVSNWLYEFTLLSIPQQNICPEDSKGNSTCNPMVLKKLEEMERKQDEQHTSEIWKGLDQFKNNIN
jgi:uncharacterized metal-binding protein YceD (DUF177 family)